MVTKQILISHPIKTLKSEVSKTNIKGYSKMKKDEIIELMLKYKSRFSHIKKREQKPKEKQKKKPKIEIPEITITEAEPDKKKVFQRGGRFFKPKELKSKLPPIPKTNIKIRLPKEKEEKKRKNFTKFDTRWLNVDKLKTRTELMYDYEEANIYIEFMIDNKTNDIFLEFQYSQYNPDNPRAPKGWTRSLVCQIVDFMIKEKMTKKTNKIGLVAGDISNNEFPHNMKKLKEMYKSMGFQEKGEDYFEMKISKFQEWCKTKYADLYFS